MIISQNNMEYINNFGLTNLFEKNTRLVQQKILKLINNNLIEQKIGHVYGFDPQTYKCSQHDFKIKIGETKRKTEIRINEQHGIEVLSHKTKFRLRLEKLAHAFFDFANIKGVPEEGTEMFLFNNLKIVNEKITKNVVCKYIAIIDDMLNDKYSQLFEQDEILPPEKIYEEKDIDNGENNSLDEINGLVLETTKVHNKLLQSLGNINILEKHLDPYYERDQEEQYRCKENVINSANKILNLLIEHYSALLCSPMQSAKSSIIGRIIEIYINKRNLLLEYGVDILPENIYLIINISSNTAREQLKEKLNKITLFRTNNVVHIRGLHKLYELTKTKKCLFIFDECHMNLGQNGISHTFMEKLHISNPECNPNHHRLYVSATPFEHINYLNIPIVIHELPDTYVSPAKINSYGLIKQAYSFKDSSNFVFTYLNEIKDDITSANNKGYIFIRLQQIRENTQKVHENIIKKFFEWCHVNNINCDFIMFDQHEKRNINDIIREEPDELIFIFVKNKLRASETLKGKKYIISMHDVPKNTKTSVTLQSLLGRCCGYDFNSKCTIYCDLSKALEGIDILENKYSTLPQKLETNVYFKNAEIIKIQKDNKLKKLVSQLDDQHKNKLLEMLANSNR